MTSAQIARTIDHAILHPTAGISDLEREAKLAHELCLFSLCVKPHHTKAAKELLASSEVLVCTVVAFPHGNSTTATKLFETTEALNDGADEIDFVINQSAASEANWKFLSHEIEQLNMLCQQSNAALKVIFENDFIHKDETIIKLCEICTEVQVAFVKSSTGFGYNKLTNGFYNYQGATERQIQLMLDNVKAPVKVKASGGIRDLQTAIKYLSMGVTRLGTSSSANILAEAKKQE